MTKTHRVVHTSPFLNVDLDLVGDSPLEPLVEALAPGLFALHAAKGGWTGRPGLRRCWWARLEGANVPKDPDAAVEAIYTAFTLLPSARRRDWRALRVRELSLGLDVQPATFENRLLLSAQTLRHIAEMACSLEVVAYAYRARARKR
ncbi:MAG: hypothetical protein HYZ53_14060 [Planctomycetes bacterium]|nr:hypothetical protein [Planctomycetota bacterium]